MKFISKFLVLSSAMFASASAQQLVPLNFNAIALEVGSTTTFSALGDTWRASNVRGNPGASMDALFTITGTTGINATQTNVEFVNELPARGNNMRVRIGDAPTVTNASIFITIRLVNAGTILDYTGWNVGDQVITQFQDLDSDFGADRSDFAGAQTSQFIDSYTSDRTSLGSSLLDLSTAYESGYTVGILETPWGPKSNVTSTTTAAQSLVTAAFVFNAGAINAGSSSFNIVVGQKSNGGAAGNRHIDIDMTPDFGVIPEPSTSAFFALTALGMGMYRRRRN